MLRALFIGLLLTLPLLPLADLPAAPGLAAVVAAEGTMIDPFGQPLPPVGDGSESMSLPGGCAGLHCGD